MRKKKHLILLWILSLVLLSTAAVPVFAEAELPKTDCEAAILIDAQSGRVLYEKDADRAVQPASLTKMMTALLVVESMNLDDTVTITTEAASIGGNAIQLKEGEQLTVRQLLNALLVYSANDAAVALGIAVSGNLPDFLTLMNRRARELGMNHTHYLSPNGLIESEKHITTARDISIITRKVLQNQELAAIVKKTRYTVPATNKGRPRPLQSTNGMLYDTSTWITVNGVKRHPKYSGTIGVKTGYMNASGYCISVAARRNHMTLIAVVMHAKQKIGRYTNAIPMLDYGFQHYYTMKLMDRGQSTGRVRVRYGHHTWVRTETSQAVYATLPKQVSKDLATTKVTLKKGLNAPLRKGTRVGTVKVYENGKQTGSAAIVSADTVAKGGPWSALYIADWVFVTICIVVAVLFVLWILFLIRRNRMRRERERKRQRSREQRARRIAAERADKRRRDWPY